MTDQQFLETVAEMRKLQKQYFKTRDRGILDRCRFTERIVDVVIAQRTNPQPNLFN